ncbi:MAG: hypothetical protein ACYCXJ_10180, partial [Thermoleophilia bacterium]
LTRMLESEGFRVAEVVYETPMYYCQMNWQYFKQRRLRLKGDVIHSPSLLDRAVVKALSLYRKVVDGNSWSSAMTVFAVKEGATQDAGASAMASAEAKEGPR